MTCQELRSEFEDFLPAEAEGQRVSTEALQHLASCPACSRFVEKRRQLAAGLRLSRERLPEVPASLDAAVLGAYRRHMAEGRAPVKSTHGRFTFAVLCWSAGAVAVFLAVFMFLSAPKNATRVTEAVHPQPVEQAVAAQQPAVTPAARRPVTPRSARKSRVPRRMPRAPEVATANSLPPGFRSLMYCDELSCEGAMEMIRVQLPSTALTLPGIVPSPQNDGVVFADVLVGADGIARGIRIVQ